MNTRNLIIILTLIQALAYINAQAPLNAASYSPLLSPSLSLGEKTISSLSTSSGQNFRDGGYVSAYSVQLEAGTVVGITVSSEDFTPILSLFTPTGELIDISSRDYPVFDFNASIASFIPTTGRYIVVVSSESSWEYGEFAILAQRLDDQESILGNPSEVEIPFQISGYLTSNLQGNWFGDTGDVYIFEVVEPAWIALTAESNDFDTVLELTDSEGNWITSNDDISPDNYNSRIFTFLDEGVYRLTVTGWWSDSEGEYHLSAARFSAID